MARCVSVSGIMFDHIGWEGDAMTIIFPEACLCRSSKSSDLPYFSILSIYLDNRIQKRWSKKNSIRRYKEY